MVIAKIPAVGLAIREYVREHGLTDADAVQKGLNEKSKEFSESGSKIYRVISDNFYLQV